MLSIEIKIIPHNSQRYNTVGDWFYDTVGTLIVVVSEMPDWRYEFLIVFHELFEAIWCRAKNINVLEVDEFDKMYESEREQGFHTFEDEPGDDARAPYRLGHFVATSLERIAAYALNVNWNLYESELTQLTKSYSPKHKDD